MRALLTPRRRRTVRGAALAPLLAAVLLVVGAPGALAGPEGTIDDDEVVIGDSTPGGSTGGDQGGGTGGGGGQGGGASGPPQPWTQEVYVVACPINTPQNPAEVLCVGATMGCAEDEGRIRYRVYVRTMSPAGEPMTPWSFDRMDCRGADEAEPGIQEPVVTTEAVVDIARAAAPTPVVGAEPGERTYVNVPTNFYAEEAGQTVTLSVLGQPIAVTFAPTEITWDFGDGSGGTGFGRAGAGVGEDGAVEHAYARSADVEVTATATYSVSFTLPGGQAVTIPGEIQSTSDPLPLQVGEIQTTVRRTR